MRSGSEEGSYLRLVDFVSLISRPRVIKKKEESGGMPPLSNAGGGDDGEDGNVPGNGNRTSAGYRLRAYRE